MENRTVDSREIRVSARDKQRSIRMKEALQLYDATIAAEDAAEDMLAAHLAAWRKASYNAPVKHVASFAHVSLGAVPGRLDLSGRGLSAIEPEHLRGLAHLQELSLVGNSLASLPHSLAQAMPSLEILNLVRAACAHPAHCEARCHSF